MIYLFHSNKGTGRFTHILRVLVLIAVVDCTTGAVLNAQRPPVTVSWSAALERISLGEPVVLNLSVRNESSSTAVLDLGQDFTQGLRVTVIKPDGTTVPTPVKEASNGFHALGTVQINPGETYTREFVIDEWYQFDSIGKYEVQASLRFPIAVANLSFIPTSGTASTILIEPRDEAALRRRCDDLATRISMPRFVDDDGYAARALSAVRDPVAVPYLIRALYSDFPYGRSIAVRALTKFSTPEAIDGLIPIARAGGPDASLIRAHLLQTAQKLPDTDLRQHIYRALREPEPTR